MRSNTAGLTLKHTIFRKKYYVFNGFIKMVILKIFIKPLKLNIQKLINLMY